MLGTALPAITSRLLEWGQAFIEWVGPKIPVLLGELGSLLAQVGGWILGTALPAIASHLVQWGTAFVRWAADAIPPLLAQLGGLLVSVGGWIIGTALPAIASQLAEWGAAFVRWAMDAIPRLLSALGQLLLSLVGWAAGVALPAIVSQASEWARAAWQWVTNEAIPGLLAVLPRILSTITGAFAGASSLLWDAGRAIMGGLISGISSKFGALRDKLGSVSNFIKSHKGPPRYDKVMLRKSGQWIMEGLIAGIDDRQGALASSLESVTSTVASTRFQPLDAPGARARPVPLPRTGRAGGSGGPLGGVQGAPSRGGDTHIHYDVRVMGGVRQDEADIREILRDIAQVAVFRGA
jgi:phage-related protein